MVYVSNMSPFVSPRLNPPPMLHLCSSFTPYQYPHTHNLPTPIRYFNSPTVLSDVQDDNLVAREEIFGPVQVRDMKCLLISWICINL